MPLISGSRLGPYEVISPLGAGGMGEVYKARDTRLDRTIAIKILPEALAADPQFRDRFDREAKAIAALTHPHICTLYDVGRQDGTDFLVMEYLEGETLAERLASGSGRHQASGSGLSALGKALPVDETLTIAIQIASALDKAHRAGITHRDLKPGNIMLTKAGAKLLDFGLAKTRGVGVAQDFSPAVASRSKDLRHENTALPTVSAPLTAQGTILGTFQYMAPEQLEGQDADARTDIFGFGAVLYEMLTGRKAFAGKSHATLIAAIIGSDPPPISQVQPLTPTQLDRIVSTCLAKDPDDRWQSARDLLRELQWVADGSASSQLQATAGSSRKRRERAAWIMATVVLLGALIVTLTYGRRGAPTAPLARFQVGPPEGASFPTGNLSNGVLSPDGLRLALVAVDGSGKRLIWIRPLDSTTAQALPGTDDAAGPFWSPDSKSIAFFANGKLKAIDISGELPHTIGDAPVQRGGTWGQDGSIVFAPRLDLGLYTVPASGGAPSALTEPDRTRGEENGRFPNFLPDGRHFTYYIQSQNPEVRGIYVGSLDSKDHTRLLTADSQAIYAAGHLLYVRGGSLMAQPFDDERLVLRGDPVRLAEGVRYQASVAGPAAFSVSATGVLTYGTTTDAPGNQLAWFDRAGTKITTVGEPGPYSNFALSPDKRSVVIERNDPQTGTGDIWTLDLSRGIASRVTVNPAQDQGPLWSPDGSRIVFFSARSQPTGSLYQKNFAGIGEEELLVKSPLRSWPEEWSADGRYIIYYAFDPNTNGDLYLLSMSGDRKPTVLLRTPFEEADARFSPDGQWMAYASNETGSYEVYVQKFPLSGATWRISTHGGREPVWRPDGKELFYLVDGKFMAVDLKTGSSGLEVGQPKAILETLSLNPIVAAGGASHRYAVSADGQRFLVNVPVGTTTLTPITVVVNWAAGLKK